MKKPVLPSLLLLAYSAMLINVLVFKNLPVIQIGSMHFKFGGSHTGKPNLVPFRTIALYMKGRNGLISWINLAGNIVLLMPVGFLTPFIFRGMSWKKALALSLFSGLLLEGLQELFSVGIFDIDDVILNGLGVMLGYWINKLFLSRKAEPTHPKPYRE